MSLVINWRYFWLALYSLLTGLTILAYPYARAIIIKQDTSFIAVLSNIPGTLNFILLFFLWGVTSDKMTKGKSKRVEWGVFIMGLIALLVFFKLVGGFEVAVFK